ncbi:MAG: hypothetical protein NW205_00230 [Hyphomicrobiaceae bacterium]|nr:hypothetical protein [Hyphomicrobiaceae bacterium]
MPNTAERGWAGMLDVLSDDELAQYGRMALDQVALERRWAWLQALLVAAAAGVMAWVLLAGWRRGFDWTLVPALFGLAVIVYWPWRSIRTRQLWRTQHDVVMGELERRRGNATAR